MLQLAQILATKKKGHNSETIFLSHSCGRPNKGAVPPQQGLAYLKHM